MRTDEMLKIEDMQAEIERLQSDRRAAAESFEQLTALWEARGTEIERLRALVREFAEIKDPLLASTAYMLRSKARDVLGLPKWMR